jgi:hypothetical protein
VRKLHLDIGRHRIPAVGEHEVHTTLLDIDVEYDLS